MRTLAALILVALTAGPAQAAEPVVWQGDLFFTSVTKVCIANNTIFAGDFARAVYRPQLVSGDPSEGLSIIFPRAALILEASGKTLRGNAAATETSIGSHAGIGQDSTTVTLKITPAKITASTPVVQISGTLRNVFTISGCNATIVGVLGLRRD